MATPLRVTEPADAAGQVLRTPPHNYEAERALLGAILMNNRAYERVHEFLRALHFADPVNGRIFESCGKLIEQGHQANPVTLKTYLERDDLVVGAGGMKYIASLAAGAVTVINSTEYGKLIYDLYLRRELIELGEEIVNKAFDATPDETAVQQIEASEQVLFNLASEGTLEGGFQSFGNALVTAINLAEAAHRREGALAGVTTGLLDLDKKLGGLHPSDLIILAGRPSMGKAQPLDAKVLTPSGWKRMGDLRLGDALVSVDGKPSRVAGIYPQGTKEIFRVTFSDGRTTECCAEHLWRVWYRTWPEPRIVDTNKLRSMLNRARYKNRLWIDLANGVFGKDAALPVDAWVLGALLGDGSLSDGAIRFSTTAPAMLDRLQERLEETFKLTAAGGCDHRVVQSAGHRGAGRQGVVPQPLKESFIALGLWDVRSEEKFIPEVYFTAPRDARLNLLRGLLDSDGRVESRGGIRFCTTSRRLADGVQALVRSLGGMCSIDGERKTGRPAYVCNLQLSDPAALGLLGAKGARTKAPVRRKRLTFASIEPSRAAPAQCIAVTHPDKLYVTDDYIVTHNTALATTIAFNAAHYYRTTDRAEDRGKHVAFFSLEMSSEQLATRILAERSKISSHLIRTGGLSNDDFSRLVVASQDVAETPLYIDDTPAVTVSTIRTRCRRLARQNKTADGSPGLGLIVIDYLQLIGTSRSEKSENRVQEVSAITRGLKALAKELNVPVMALSQLSRAVEQREDKRPQLADLRESGSIEQDADAVMFVYREQYYLERAEPSQRPEESSDKFAERHTNWQQRCEQAHNVAEAIVAKQRHGPIGTVRLYFDANYTHFSDLIDQSHLPPPIED